MAVSDHDRLGIEFLSVFNLPPVEYVELAAALGVRNISTGLMAMSFCNPHSYPLWSLRDDAALRRDMRAALHEHGVTISLAEGFSIRPGIDARERAADLDVFAELGARRINAVSLDPDLSRSVEQFGRLAEMAAVVGLETTVEFGPGMTIADLPAALALVRQIGRDDFRLLIDTMHLVRSGGSAADIAALDPALIGYMQLCDAPHLSRHLSYMEEAMFARQVPGEGELPLRDIVAALPADVVISLEVPQRALAEAGIGPRERVGHCVTAARRLLARAASAQNDG